MRIELHIRVFFILLAIAVAGVFVSCGGESSADGDIDTDTGEKDNNNLEGGDLEENSPDGDVVSDGDESSDGDNDSDGDETSDGDVTYDGDCTGDGDDMADGDVIIDGDDAPDGDSDIAEEENPPEVRGYVSLWETAMRVDSARSTFDQTVSISASFYLNEMHDGDEVTEVGQCRIYPVNQNAYQYTMLDAGRITVFGAVLSPVYSDCENIGKSERSGCMYYFEDVYQLDDLFDPGDHISADVAGNGDVPSFELELDAPQELAGLSPDIFADSYYYDAGEPLSLSWQPGDNKQMVQLSIQAYVYSNYQLTDGYSLYCLTEDDGSFDVPSGALEYLPDAANYTSITISRQISTVKRKDDVETTLSIGSQLCRVWSFIN